MTTRYWMPTTDQHAVQLQIIILLTEAKDML